MNNTCKHYETMRRRLVYRGGFNSQITECRVGTLNTRSACPQGKLSAPIFYLLCLNLVFSASLRRIPISCRHFFQPGRFQGWKQDSKLYFECRTRLEKVCERCSIFGQTRFGSPSLINLLACPCFQLYLILIAHYMTIYLNSVQICVIACTIENLDFSEF